jgi:hypothetical protein
MVYGKIQTALAETEREDRCERNCGSDLTLARNKRWLRLYDEIIVHTASQVDTVTEHTSKKREKAK